VSVSCRLSGANVMKHSQAKTVIVAGELDGAIVRLRISDDGVGFDPTVSHSGIGLTSMRERFRLVDAVDKFFS